MPTQVRNDVRREVLKYLNDHTAPVRMSSMAEDLREQNQGLSGLLDADFRSVVQPMIATGKLSYAPGLKIRLGKASK
jgi:hypothetical protein